MLPRMDEQIKENLQRRNLAWSKDRVELPLALEKQRLDVARQKVQIARSKERLKNLLADQELMKIKSPADGYVYYGRCQRGKFNEITSIDGNAPPRRQRHAAPRVHDHRRAQALVHPLHDCRGSLAVHPHGHGRQGLAHRISGPEARRYRGRSRQGADILGQLRPSIQPGPGGPTLENILPGMGCKIKLTPYIKSDALVVPPKLVSTDPLDDEKHFVYLQTKDGKAEKHDVTIGKQNDKQMEILKGLSDGDKILLEPPKDAK